MRLSFTAAALALTGVIALSAAEAGFESLNSIRTTAESFVRGQLPKDATTLSVAADKLDARLHFAQCPGPLHATLPSGAVLQARTTVAVSCDMTPAWTVYVPVTADSQVNYLVLRHPVMRDARLTGEDVELQKRPLNGSGIAFLTELNDLKARSVKRPLPAGAALSIDMFNADVLIHQGQQVTLVASIGGLQVRATGRALTNASAGARLRVQNLSSLKVVEGVVENEDVIRVSP